MPVKKSVHIGRKEFTFSVVIISFFFSAVMLIAIGMLQVASFPIWLFPLGFFCAFGLYIIYAITIIEGVFPRFWKTHVTKMQWSAQPKLALRIHILFATALAVMLIIFFLTFMVMVTRLNLTGLQVITIGLYFEISYLLAFPYFAKIRSSYLGLGYDRFGEASVYCASAYAKVAQTVLPNYPEDAVKYLTTSLTMAARTLRIEGFSDLLIRKAVTTVKAAQMLSPGVALENTKQLARALSRLPDFKELSEAASNYLADTSLSWTKPFVVSSKKSGTYWPYVERAITILIGIGTIIGVLVSESLKERVSQAATALPVLEILLLVLLLLILPVVIALTSRIVGASPSLPKGVSLGTPGGTGAE